MFRTIVLITVRWISNTPLKKSRTICATRDQVRRFVNSFYVRRNVPFSQIRTSTREVDLIEGWGGKDISEWPPYGFLKTYLDGQREAASTSYYNWYMDQLKKYYNVPGSKGGRAGFFQKYGENHQRIKYEVDSRFALLESIRENGFDAHIGDPITGVRNNRLIYLLSGHHRWAILKLLGYTSIPKVRILGLFDDKRFYKPDPCLHQPEQA